MLDLVEGATDYIQSQTAFLVGQYSSADQPDCFAFSSGRFAANGDAQVFFVTMYGDETHNDTDYIGDLEIAVTVHYWSRFAQVVAFDAHEGYRYYIGAEANLPSTEVSYEMWQAELPPDYQEVIVLRNLERLPFNEVADRMSRTRPAAQMLWLRAIRKLQEVLGE